MFVSTLVGFCLGFLMPAASSRFGKILPADPGHVLLNLWHTPRFPKVDDVPRARDLYEKWKKLIAFSFLWGALKAKYAGQMDMGKASGLIKAALG